MKAGYVRILPGATAWMKERGFWLRGWPDSIDGMFMSIVGDYSHLPGDSAHFWCENESVRDCGVHPQFLQFHCVHCGHEDCECSDADVSPDMGAK